MFNPFLGFKTKSTLSTLEVKIVIQRLSRHFFSNYLSCLSSLGFSPELALGPIFLLGTIDQLLVSKLKLSGPMEKLNLKLWLDITSSWQKSWNFSITKTPIFTAQNNISKGMIVWPIALFEVETGWQCKGSNMLNTVYISKIKQICFFLSL